MRTFGLIGVVIWSGIFGFFGSKYRFVHKETICGKEEYRYNVIFAIIVFLPVILWAGFRGGAGYVDTNAYINMYSTIPTSVDGLIGYLKVQPDDFGFTILMSIIKVVFGSNYTPFLLIIAIVEGGAVISLYRKFSSHYLTSVFLFIVSTEYFSWMFNGIRQFLAVSIIMLAFPFLLEKKYIKYFLLIGLAATIHMTAIIMIPLALVVTGKPWNVKTLFMIAIGIFALMMTSMFTDLLSVATQNTQYSGVIDSWNETGDDGTNPIRVLVYAVPTIFAFFGRKNLESLKNPVVNICVNFSIVSTVMWLISMVTSGIYMGRLPIYASVYNYILLPYEIDALFSGKVKSIVFVTMIGMYLFYYYYQLHFIWGVI